MAVHVTCDRCGEEVPTAKHNHNIDFTKDSKCIRVFLAFYIKGENDPIHKFKDAHVCEQCLFDMMINKNLSELRKLID